MAPVSRNEWRMVFGGVAVPAKMATKKLYRMMYDRLVHFHHLNNLIWIFGGNEVR